MASDNQDDQHRIPPPVADGAEENVPIGGNDPNRMLDRRSPIDHSRSGLVSRDYQPRTGGPELVAAWPIGSPPAAEGPGLEDWVVEATEPMRLGQVMLQLPYALPVDYAPGYCSVVGRASVPDDAMLTLTLDCRHLDGPASETAIRLSDEDDAPFVSPMIDVVPETTDYEPEGRVFADVELRASCVGGRASVVPGTTIQLWSE